MNIELKTKGLTLDNRELQLVQSMLMEQKLTIPVDNHGLLMVEKVFTSPGKEVLFRCELEIQAGKKSKVSSSRSGSNLLETASSAIENALVQLAFISKLSQAT